MKKKLFNIKNVNKLNHSPILCSIIYHIYWHHYLLWQRKKNSETIFFSYSWFFFDFSKSLKNKKKLARNRIFKIDFHFSRDGFTVAFFFCCFIPQSYTTLLLKLYFWGYHISFSWIFSFQFFFSSFLSKKKENLFVFTFL